MPWVWAPGDLEPYVQDFYRGDNMLGGCIWEFCDHAAYHADGPVHYTYGGDHGETNTTVIFAPTVCSSRIEPPMPGLIK